MPQTPGMSASSLSFGMTIMSQVLVPRILTSVPSLMPAPTAPMCASKAPTAMAMPGLQAQLVGPLLAQPAGEVVGRHGLVVQPVAQVGQRGVERGQELLVRQPAPFLAVHGLVAGGADAAHERRPGRVLPASRAGM